MHCHHCVFVQQSHKSKVNTKDTKTHIRVKEKYQSVEPNIKHKDSQDLNLVCLVTPKPGKHIKSNINKNKQKLNN